MKHDKPNPEFIRQLKFVLREFHNPQLLGEASVFATPYCLGHKMVEEPNLSDVLGRGEILQNELRRSAQALWKRDEISNRDEFLQMIQEVRKTPGTPQYSYVVLELRCFHTYIAPKHLRDIWEHETLLPGSRSQHYRDYDFAVEQLAPLFLQQIMPTFRLEQPPKLQNTIIGYESEYERCLHGLNNQQTVAISGGGGVGKTTLGAFVATQGSQGPIFWYTIRPGLNDRVESILFALGCFLHSYECPHLWQYVLAEKGKLQDIHLALGLLREDLHSIRGRLPVLCFDEVDQLHVTNTEQHNEHHIQILELLDSLRGQLALLLIGQRPILEANVYCELTGLNSKQINHILSEAGVLLAEQEICSIHNYTSGNPRFILLIRIMLESGVTIDELVIHLPQTAALFPIFHRVWLRLTNEERFVLQALSVFQHPAPEEVWQDVQGALESGVKRGLIQRDGYGGITLLPALQVIISEQLSIEEREALHIRAAEIRYKHYEYTLAAYHYHQAGEDHQAIHAWYPQREIEIQRGQAHLAQTIFWAISRQRISKQEQKALDLIRAELHWLQGNARNGLDELKHGQWHSSDELNIKARILQGTFYDAIGFVEESAESYQQGVQIAVRILGQLSFLHYRRGLLFVRNKDIESARNESRLAHYDATLLQGNLEELEGRYLDAQFTYQHALSVAEDIKDQEGIVRAQLDLFRIFGHQHQLEQALPYSNAAIDYLETIGDQMRLAVVHSNLAGFYMDAGKLDKAIETGTKALKFFRAVEHPYWVANTANNIAEAYFDAGDLENAEIHAQEVLDQEERVLYPYGLYTLGRVERTKGDFARALIHFTQSARMAQQNEDPYMEAYAQRELGKVYLDQGDLSAGNEALTKACQLFEQLGIEDELATTEQLLLERGSVGQSDGQTVEQ